MRPYYSSGLIFNAVAWAFDTTLADMLKPGRLQRNADARQAAAYMLRYRGNVAPCDIVRLMGKGYKWSYWAVQAAINRLQTDKRFRRGVEQADAILAGKEVAA